MFHVYWDTLCKHDDFKNLTLIKKKLDFITVFGTCWLIDFNIPLSDYFITLGWVIAFVIISYLYIFCAVASKNVVHDSVQGIQSS